MPICARGLLRQIDDEAAALDCEAENVPEAVSAESRWYAPPRYLADQAPINYSARIEQFLLGIPAEICDNAGCLPLTVAAAACR